MRSIIFISLIMLAPVVVQGQGMPLGCYARDYSAAHLAKNPDQTVAQISIDIGAADIDEIYTGVAVVRATMADAQSTRHLGQVGQTYDNSLICRHVEDAPNVDGNWTQDGAFTCFGECDGGFLQVVNWDAKSLLIRTEYVAMGDDGCGGAPATLGDDNARGPTTYKLFAAPRARCAP